MPRPKRTEREIERARVDMVWAAADVFARRGVAAATMQEIASEAGCATSTVYSYVDGKEAMSLAVMQEFSRELLAVFDERLPTGSTLAQSVELLVDRLLGACERRRSAMLVMIGMAAHVHMGHSLFGGGHEEVGDIGMMAIAVRIDRWFSESVATTELGPHGPTIAAQLLLGILHAVFFRWAHEESEGKLTDRVPLVVELFLHGVSGGAGR